MPLLQQTKQRSFICFQAWRWRKQSLQGELSFQRLLKSPEVLETLVDLGDEMSLGMVYSS